MHPRSVSASAFCKAEFNNNSEGFSGILKSIAEKIS